MRRAALAPILGVLLGVLAGCASNGEGASPATEATTADDTTTTSNPPVDDIPADDASTAGAFPDVVAVDATLAGDGTWRFDVTISSPYDTPERYADAWRVVAPDGTELGIRVLLHDHANEQPFTRSQSGIEIPADVEVVTVEARDLVNGWGGGTVRYTLAR